MISGTDRPIVVLGAGITGLTAAWELSQTYPGRVVLLEKEVAVGGLAATFSKGPFAFDIGSHRLHEGYHPEVDRLVLELCGPDLLRRDRNGLIFIHDRPFRYPPSALDIMSAFGLTDLARFTIGFLVAQLWRVAGRGEADSFEDYATSVVGRGLYERFYKPYAIKLYGMSPRAIAKDPAVSRVRKFSRSALLRDLLSRLSGEQGTTYLYPAHGIGQLATALQDRFLGAGGRLRFISRIDAIRTRNDRTIESVAVRMRDGTSGELEASLVVSTLPIDVLHHLVSLDTDRGGPPAFDLQWRGLRLLYLLTPDRIRAEHETYYFPEPHIPFGRVSELNKYSPALNQDPTRSVLTIEVPCSPGDETWTMTDDRLAEVCTSGLQKMGILRTPSSGRAEYFSRRIEKVYPVYSIGWRERFEAVYRRLDALDNLYMIGRGALFLHCNIDHCMLMAIELARHLSNGHTDKAAWDVIRKGFFSCHVRE